MYVGNAVWGAVYAALNGTINGGVHDGEAPPDTDYPYTILGEATEVTDEENDAEGSEMTGTLHVWSESEDGSELDTILAQIDAVLHRSDLTVAGARCWSVFREFTQAMMDPETNEEGRQLRHGVVRYRFKLEPAA